MVRRERSRNEREKRKIERDGERRKGGRGEEKKDTQIDRNVKKNIYIRNKNIRDRERKGAREEI